MIPAEFLAINPDAYTESIVYVDTDHVIRYMNEAGKRHYAKWGDITGKSLFYCHNEASRKVILEYFHRLTAGEDEILYFEKPERRVYIRSVRNSGGTLLGYYEIHETVK